MQDRKSLLSKKLSLKNAKEKLVKTRGSLLMMPQSLSICAVRVGSVTPVCGRTVSRKK